MALCVNTEIFYFVWSNGVEVLGCCVHQKKELMFFFFFVISIFMFLCVMVLSESICCDVCLVKCVSRMEGHGAHFSIFNRCVLLPFFTARCRLLFHFVCVCVFALSSFCFFMHFLIFSDHSKEADVQLKSRRCIVDQVDSKASEQSRSSLQVILRALTPRSFSSCDPCQ